MVRNDCLKKHKGRCVSCAKINSWKNDDYAKRCSESHRKPAPLRRLPYGEANFNDLYGSYKSSASTRGIFFDLTKEQFKLLTRENCYYCGIEPLQIYNKRGREYTHGYWVYNGIDRKNDTCGYEINNCVPSCKVCNYAKQGLTDVEFFNHIDKIYKYHNFK